MAVTLKDIAQASGVSVATASRALRGMGYVDPERAHRVRRVAAELGYWRSSTLAFPSAIYRPNTYQSLRVMLARRDARGTRPLGQRGLQLEQSIRSAIELVEGEFLAHDLVAPEVFEQALSRFKPHGVILDNMMPLRWLEDISRRVAVVGKSVHSACLGIDTADVNEALTAARIVDWLDRLGHRHFAWVGIENYNDAAQKCCEAFGEISLHEAAAMRTHTPRFAAWEAYTRRHVEPMYPHRILVDRDWHTTSHEEAVAEASDRLLALRPRPTVAIAASAVTAHALIEALARRGVRVPHDIGVMGYGSHSPPPDVDDRIDLATVLLPVQRIGQLAAELIQRRVGDPQALSLNLTLEADIYAGNTLMPLAEMDRESEPRSTRTHPTSSPAPPVNQSNEAQS